MSDVVGIKSDKSRFDYRKGGNLKWTAKVEAVLLERVTPDAVDRWRHDYVARAESPEMIRKKKTSANSLIRQAKALFSSNVKKRVSEILNLPEQLPFDGIENF
ncbi:MAG: hypothetical protein AAF558_14555 [Verrucomicrobiota bacterium]